MMSFDWLSQQFSLLTIREKVLILITGLVLIGIAGSLLLVEPQFKAWQQAVKEAQATEKSIVSTERQIAEIDRALSQEMNPELKQQINQLSNENTQIKRRLLKLNETLISKHQMTLALRSLLSERNDLKLVSFKSLPPELVLTQDAEQPDNKGKPLLYKHSIVISVEGKYFSILKFLQQIERKGDHILWSGVNYLVSEYPKASAKIEVYTLSTDKEFISVNG